MPARQLNRPNVEESSFLQDLPTVKQSSQQSQGGAGSPFAPALVIESNELIDSALLNAIENPRERMQVLNLENVLLIFVKSRYVLLHLTYKSCIYYIEDVSRIYLWHFQIPITCVLLICLHFFVIK
jgi:hypothetical protein